MPGEDHDHGAKVNTFRDAGDVGKKLQRIRHHRIGCEMMLHGPHAVEAGLIGDPCDIDFLKEYRPVGGRWSDWRGLPAFLCFIAIPVLIVLNEYRGSYAHADFLSSLSASMVES